MELLGLILTYDFINTASYAICILPISKKIIVSYVTKSVTEPLIK